ncbi:aminotransferase class V-fold PLP-dependent enzyme [Amycolatopsis australiensis]|uniref:Pyridoxal 5-phosphate dependent beta-lyase n=1 Tax=Amycolatopsis australiensis TaxID=546364 RepID=A0A1K1RTU3_9PSEU|nr:aminotransferase class V-fold PLP-dependent enzyme [Amycolatopsis australiensis]SFW75346.1 pyridoxal 5-phosphate dependent beta-lyase [Amycolatopsis australiensis]
MIEIPDEQLGRAWAERRPRTAGLHVDTAACGRTSGAVRARVARHQAAEARRGGYVAEAAIAGELREARARLGALLGFGAEDVAFTESASTALAQLLAAWPVEAGDVVWAPRSDWGPSLAALADRGLRVELLDVDSRGVLDVEALAARLRRERPALVHVTAALSHRAVLQPVAECVAACAEYEVPVVLDAAQALGQFRLPPGAAAAYGTGRKFLCGPRGVGYVAVADPWQGRLVPRAPALAAGAWPGESRPVRRLESREAFVAGRAGLAVALAEFEELGPSRIMRRLAEVGAATRRALAEVPGWAVCDPVAAPGAIVALRPADDVDPAAVRERLVRRGVVCSVAGAERAPHHLTGSLLRFSPHIDVTAADLERLVRVLASCTGP